MNSESNPPEISRPIKPDNEQMLRVRRGYYILLGVFIHTIISFLLWEGGLFHVSGIAFVEIFSVIWAGYITYFIFIKTGFSRRFEDQNLTMPIVFWAVTSVMYTVSLTTEVRSLLLMFNLLVLVFSAFYLDKRQYIAVTLYGIILYIIIIFYLVNLKPNHIHLKEESAVFFGYLFLSSALAFICYKMSSLRKELHQKNKKLGVAVKRVAALSMTDELTKVKNRRYIVEVLRHQALMAERGKYSFSVCMLDIDHFKKINDTYGHQIGDDVLKTLCQKILAVLRKIDYFGRIGGEEFLFVLPLVDEEQAKHTAERIRILIENLTFDEILPGLKITVSLGVTVYQPPEKIETTLARVDAALYAAKRAGRNQVAV